MEEPDWDLSKEEMVDVVWNDNIENKLDNI